MAYTTEIYYHIVHKLRSPRSRCTIRLVPSEGCGKIGGGGNLFHGSPLASGGLLVIFGLLWLIEASPQSLPSSFHGILPVCISVPKFLLCIRIPVILEYKPTLLQYNLILTEYIYNDPISK